MPLDVVLTMGGLAFLGIGLCWFLESTEARRNARHVDTENHAGLEGMEMHERRQAVSPKRKRSA